MKEYDRVWARIDLDAIRENIRLTRKLLKPETEVMGIIKADGYGHGAIPIARAVGDGFDSYGVAIAEEGAELRQAGFRKPILILGYTPASQYEMVLRHEITPTVFTAEMAEGISEEAVRQKKKAKIHLKIDTGMGRIGFPVSKQSVKEIQTIAKLPGLWVEGCFSHFSKADEEDKSYARWQLSQFQTMCEWLRLAGMEIPKQHISNSAGIMDLPEAQLSMVRSGISTYGLYPSEEVKKERLPLRPALSWYSCVSYVKWLEEGSLVGYGGTYQTERKTRVATIPVGYADGYRRELSNRGRVLLHGKSVPIIGRVCMDQFMVDVTEISELVQVGDTVTLLGRDREAVISAEEIGALTHSFSYEVVCGIGKRVPRVYYDRGEKVGTCDYYDTAEKAFCLR